MAEYYSVSEYAAIMGKDVGNIRRMLINGDLQGEKIGKQWVIAKDTVYPKDKRVKSGNYIGWRKKRDLYSKNPNLIKKLLQMCIQLQEIFDNYLESIILYGSYARGEQTAESDVDIAVMLRKGYTEHMHDEMVDVVVDYELDTELMLSIIPINFENYLEWKNVLPFYKNIEKEGIVLWKST